MDSSTPLSDRPPVRVIKPKAAPLPYVPALGPGLRFLLILTFAAVAVLGATAAYTGAVKLLDWWAAPTSYATPFTLWMFLAHSALGTAMAMPFVIFGLWHFATAWKRTNKAAISRGIITFVFGLAIIFTGFALFQLDSLPQLPTGTWSRAIVYWLHVAIPFVAVWAYVAHRKAGPRIKWGVAKWWAAGVTAFVGGMVALHSQDPHRWFAEGPKDGEKYFHPSEARTSDGKFIPAESLMSDAYCKQCHADAANDHFHSAHKFSSFNNPAYLASVKETREYGMAKQGSVQSSRWCAGCHDPVPFFSGAFDDPKFDMDKHPTAHAGVTCVACHSITHVNGPTGNAAYTIEAPSHYPFAFSENETLRTISNQVVKAKPDVHKKTFLKPFHKTAEFCSTCHKVALPVELNDYKDFLRGQNHYDTYILSGASGNGARSFYYPEKAFGNCASCHMPLKESQDFGAKDFDGSGKRKIHNHQFVGANTGLPTLLKNTARYSEYAPGWDKLIAEHKAFLTGTEPDGKKKLRIDLFAVKEAAGTGQEKLLPIRPVLPVLKPGESYVFEVVIRTLLIGHPFTQGTVDSNEVWVDFQATADGKEIARNGGMAGPGDTGPVDRWAHFLNVLMLDRNGNRINRRNPQDIFTPLYDHQIPPGAANVVHYKVDVPADVKGPVELKVRLRYRKFDHEYMQFVHGKEVPVPPLPIVDICEDKVTLPVAGMAGTVPPQESPIKPAWQRWNDYGIANLLEGGVGAKRGNYRAAEAAFQAVVALNNPDATPHGYINMARVYIEEGRLAEAAVAIQKSGEGEQKAPWWTRAWLTAVVNSETATRAEHLDAAIAELERIIDPDSQMRERGFDFRKDYVIQNLLANRLFKRRLFEADGSPAQKQFVLRAIDAAEAALAVDPDDVQAHDMLKQCYTYLSGNEPPTTEGAITLADLPALASTAANRSAPVAERIAAANRFRQGVDGVGKIPPQRDQPKLPVLRSAWKELRPAFHGTTDPELQTALAGALATLHREFHSIFKPDEVARSNAARIYRASHPEANYAARDRVVYPTTEAQRKTILAGGELFRE